MLVHRENVGRIAVLTLNNPPANGYSYAMHRELDAHVCDVRMDTGIDVIVIRGAGDRFFCAGADIAYLNGLEPEEKYYFCLHANETLLRLESTPKLVIAALNGHCVGGGLEIALACDLRIGKESGEKPTLVGLPEVALGVLPGTGGTQRLTRIVGRAKAMQLMVEGQNLSVEQAADLGIVHSVLPADDWWQSVLAYARSFCAPQKAAGAVGLIKRAVAGGADLPLESALGLERELQQRLFTSPDAKEGLAAFLGKRPGVFSGRPVPGPGGVDSEGGGQAPRNAPPAKEASSAASAAPAEAAKAAPAAPIPAPAAPTIKATTAKATAAEAKASGRAIPPAKPVEPARATPSTPSELGELAVRTPPSTPTASALAPHEGVPSGSIFEDALDEDTAPPPAQRPEVELDRVKITDAVLELIPTWLVRQFLVIPLRKEGDTLVVAMEDPSNEKAHAAIRDHTGLGVRALRADRDDLLARYTMHYRL